MAKIIPIIAVSGRHTPSGAIEVCLTDLAGKDRIIALMPSTAAAMSELLSRLKGEPETIAVEVLSLAARRALKAMAAGEPLRSGGFRVSADPLHGIVHLQVAASNGSCAEIPLDAPYARRLLEHLTRALDAVRPPSGAT